MYTRHTSSCRCVGCPCSPQSLTYVSSWGFTRLPPSCTSNYFGYITAGCTPPVFLFFVTFKVAAG
ncbi:hypothetical protein D5072_19935 [Dickeya dianthicola]|uniref:Uncharacterized protein n=1 Tax=Dickeya dianthicola TaxID=204039 RepID=A0AAX1C7M1_9GAMM|nr:hypothetical protein DF213_09870 [Dickeya dianthicola]RJL62814.1 hypothetical protein D5072_19935 [Dickeya dianthicola]RJL70912.1 hypothetical protein D5077_13420 [Dickeya dianthicola]